MVATRLDILVEQGATLEIVAEVLDAGGVDPRTDLAGWTGAMQIRPTADSATVLATADVAVDGATAQVTASVPDYLTSAMAWRSGVYDLIITDGDRTERLLYGVARLRSSTTREATPVTVVNSINGQSGIITGFDADDVGAIAKTVVTTKGDLIVGGGAGLITRLAAAVNGRVLTTDDTVAEGVSWLPPASTINVRGAWAAATAYAVGDLATLGGELLYCTTAHTSGSTFALTNWTNLTAKPGRYNVKLYGAKGDGSTDDTASINAAVSAAFTAETASGTSYAEIFFPVGEYIVSAATTKGGATQGNAQIPLPVVATTDEKFIIVFRGETEDATGFVHWQQTVAQRSGAVVRSTLTGLASDPTWLAPSIIGGPTIAQGSGIFSNLKVVFRGLTVMAPVNPGIIAVDLRYCAQAGGSLACLANAPAVGSPSITTTPTNDLGIGLRAPQNGNNDCAFFDDVAIEGFYYSTSVGEHFTASRFAAIYTNVAVFIAIGGGSFHGCTILNMSVEAAQHVFQTSATPGSSWPLFVGQLAMESIGSSWVDDANNALHGVVYYTETLDAAPVFNGGANLKVLCVSQRGEPGPKAAPSVPASTTPLTNPFARDCVVIVNGGTVSAIAVAGTATGYTSTGHTVVVPAGKTITLTYSSAPTWTWLAL
jgi:hypothetical protein